jgi:hypothetical protein
VLAAAIVLTACQRDHGVRVLLGPTEDSLTLGFRCVQDADPGKLLFTRAVTGGEVRFNLVIDIVSFGDRFPGCRGEEILHTCDEASCSIPAHRDGSARFCLPVAFPLAVTQNEATLLATLRSQLDGQVVVDDAPDGPVTIRAVATTQPCAPIEDARADGTYPSLDGDLAVGCAYSCPLVLDEAQGSILLSFDTLTNRCEQGVRVCASFPGPP